jgi:hypothetical protein
MQKLVDHLGELLPIVGLDELLLAFKERAASS